jgi:hypothetical protein
MRRWIVVSGLILGCAAPPTGSVTLRSGQLALTEKAARLEILACHGEAYCKEMSAPSFDQETRVEAHEECTRRNGKTATDACPRARVVATCRLSGEHGPITVYTYTQANPNDEAHAVSTMSELCESAGGAFEPATP